MTAVANGTFNGSFSVNTHTQNDHSVLQHLNVANAKESKK